MFKQSPVTGVVGWSSHRRGPNTPLPCWGESLLPCLPYLLVELLQDPHKVLVRPALQQPQRRGVHSEGGTSTTRASLLWSGAEQDGGAAASWPATGTPLPQVLVKLLVCRERTQTCIKCVWGGYTYYGA